MRNSSGQLRKSIKLPARRILAHQADERPLRQVFMNPCKRLDGLRRIARQDQMPDDQPFFITPFSSKVAFPTCLLISKIAFEA